jgi:hypothetical protein
VLEVAGADAAIVALGLDPALEERIAAKLMERYRGNDVLASYLTELEQVESEAIADLVGRAPAPAGYLALAGSEEEPDASALAQVKTHWEFLLTIPAPPNLRSAASLMRTRLVNLIKTLTYGEVPGIVENDDDPGTPLAYRLARWQRLDAALYDPTAGTLRTKISFVFESKVHMLSREVG